MCQFRHLCVCDVRMKTATRTLLAGLKFGNLRALRKAKEPKPHAITTITHPALDDGDRSCAFDLCAWVINVYRQRTSHVIPVESHGEGSGVPIACSVEVELGQSQCGRLIDWACMGACGCS